MVSESFLVLLGALFLSLVVLFKSSQYVIKYAVQIAARLKLSELTVGFLLVAIATSLPELFVSTISSFEYGTDLAFGNVFGANIADIALVLGLTAVLSKVLINAKELKNLVLVLIATSLMSLVLLLYNPGKLTGVFFIIIFFGFSYFTLTKKHGIQVEQPKEYKDGSFPKEIALFLISSTVLVLSAQFAVEYAVKISTVLGLAQTIIGATIISLGTTLPELSTSLLAAKGKHYSLAIGNVVGSTIINLSLILGLSLIVSPIAGIQISNFLKLIVFSIIANMVLLYFIVIQKKLGKREGIILVFGYIIYFLLFFFGK